LSYGARRQDQAWLSELAGQAFAYEDCIFDSAQQNWPDLRHYHSWRATRVMPPPHQVAWCHGAAGIALSRLWAFEITGDATFAEAARKAGATVQRGACEEARVEETSSGLCHGLAGNADVLETLRLRLGMSAFAPAATRA
jgi:lantibiotic modifying enzyme